MNTNQRIELAKKSLNGLSIGDAFGESFFGERDEMLQYIQAKKIPETTWEFTDDTVMAIAVFEQLEKNVMTKTPIAVTARLPEEYSAKLAKVAIGKPYPKAYLKVWVPWGTELRCV